MLSGTPRTGRVSRPRPPGSRRSSARTETGTASGSSSAEGSKESSPTLKKKVSQSTLLPSPALHTRKEQQHRSASTPVDAVKLASSLRLERDLDLDLPLDLTAALESSMHQWPKRRHVSDNVHRRRAARHESDTEEEREVDDGRSRSNQSRRKNDHAGISPRRQTLGQIRDPHNYSEQSEAHSDQESLEAGNTRLKHRPTQSFDSTATNTGSDISFDAAWVCGLPREELEKLLFESRQIIKDRERDLGIAATIGKALLEKNISLRNRHEGIVSRFSSLNSLSSMHSVEQAPIDAENEVQQDDVDTPLPRYSPPQTDAEGDIKDHNTPRPPQNEELAGSYFQGIQASPTAVRLARMRPLSTLEHGHTIENGSGGQHWDSPAAKSHYVRSTPVSPGENLLGAAVQHGLPASDTHRRLDLISMQNDELLEQIAQLQQESEKAKRDGGKRQKKLIREIDGLRAELDAAESRNTELERTAAEQNKVEKENEPGKRRTRKKIWRRRGTLPWKNAENDDSGGLTGLSPTGKGVDPGLRNRDDGRGSDAGEEVDAASQYAKSESEMSAASRHLPQTDAERAIVAQLMAKVRELEEINGALIQDAHERDGRIGRFVEDSERLRDLYDAAESEVNQSFSAAASMQDLHQVSPATYSDYYASPATLARRAAGNRYLIEGRRTIRAAMRPESTFESVQLGVDDVRFDSSAENSPNSALDASPTRARHLRRAMRPRILLTPSCEDLQAQAELDRANAAASLSASNANRLQIHGTRSDMSLRERYICEDSSEEEDMDNSFDTRSVRRSLRHRSSEGQLYGLGARSAPNSHRTLSCELEGEGESQYQIMPDQHLARSTSTRSMLAPSASIASLRAMSEAGSDIADIQWTSNSLSVEDDLGQDIADVHAMIPTSDSIRALTLRQAPSALVRAQNDDLIDEGLWYAAAAQEIIPYASLKDNVATSHQHYVQLERMSTNLPVHWADDEDFGRPITERDARKIGLLEEIGRDVARTGRRKGRSLLSWIKPKGLSSPDPCDQPSTTSNRRQIESVEDAARRHELEGLLRAKRNAALHDRVVSGQLSLDEAREKGAYDHGEDLAKYSGLANYSFESEVTKRAFAYRTIRRRGQSSPRSLSPCGRHRLSNGNSPSGFEMAERDGEEGKGKQRSEDYRSLTLRQRYTPTVVKQRVTRFSSETVTWALAWATFSVVMVLAFVSAFARGPKRLLYGQVPRT